MTFDDVHIDGRLVASAQERANLASKIVAAEDVESKAKKQNQWFLEKAEEAGLELDEDNFDEGLALAAHGYVDGSARPHGARVVGQSIIGRRPVF